MGEDRRVVPLLDADRSDALIDVEDLLRLDDLAAHDEEDLFRRIPGGAGRYRGRLICRALCQGAALHFVDDVNGVKDFDVWSFYRALDSGPYPYRRIGNADFGPSKFGRWPGDGGRFAGRRVDLIGRSLPAMSSADPVSVLRSYLAVRGTESARLLAAKAVVLINPRDRAGEVVWPLDAAALAKQRGYRPTRP
jgi:hypothetical protein